ncbi:MAG: DUF429 domain-containing protein [Promethearchaeota archaeon]
MKFRFVGIDLAGIPKNPTGWAILEDKCFTSKSVYENSEILDATIREKPTVVAIDAPLSLPSNGSFRDVDLKLIKSGYRLFPPLFGAMRSLTYRGVRLARDLREYDIYVTETHPLSARKALGFPLRNKARIINAFQELGYGGIEMGVSLHELDAITGAFTAKLHHEHKTITFESCDGAIILPCTI